MLRNKCSAAKKCSDEMLRFAQDPPEHEKPLCLEDTHKVTGDRRSITFMPQEETDVDCTNLEEHLPAQLQVAGIYGC